MYDLLKELINWLAEYLLWLPRSLYELATDGLASFIEAIPAPEFMSNLGSWVSGIDPAIAYFGAPLQLGTGMTFVVLAWVLRFAIRRIPLIG